MHFVLAMLPALLYGTQQLLMAAFPASPRRQNVGVLIGAGLLSLAAAPIVGGHWSLKAGIIGIISGIAWAAGQIFILKGFRAWGVSRTMPVAASGQITLNALAGILLLGEWRAPGALPVGLTALLLIMGGAAVCSWQEPNGATRLSPAARRAALSASLLCSVLYAAYPPVMRLAEVSSADALAPMGVGLLLGAVMCAVVQERSEPAFGRSMLPSVGAGVSWAVGNAILLLSTATVGVATSLALSQVSFAISSVGGIVLLGEHRTRRELAATVGGILVALVGVGLLGLASALDS